MVTRRNRKIIHHINVTPLVDVMLVLLIIFMVTSPMLVTGINIDLPTSKATPISGQDEPLEVSVDKNGRIYINTSQILTPDLIKKLKAITREKYDTKIFVSGDKFVNYDRVIKIMGMISSAGFSKVTLLIEPGS